MTRGWVDEEHVWDCACGYLTECAVHCGSGHENGTCPERHPLTREDIKWLSAMLKAGRGQ